MLIDIVTNIIFPPVCVACRTRVPGGVLCEQCFGSVKINDALMCGECHARVSKISAAQGHSPCHPSFPFLLGGAASYENPVAATLIHNLKFRSIKSAAQPLGEFLYKYTAQIEIDISDYIIAPIPLSKRRQRERGFNQAGLIAHHFTNHVQNMKLGTNILVRTKYTKPQSETGSPSERSENIRGAFTVCDPEAIRGKNILLIDDVSTSGSTFLEAALALKSAGAAKIIALAVTKT